MLEAERVVVAEPEVFALVSVAAELSAEVVSVADLEVSEPEVFAPVSVAAELSAEVVSVADVA
ncbi:MAG: hypothetical protein ABSB94_15985 [Syntrophorhabdales bacterium]